MGRIHDFFAVALAEQGWALRKSAVGLFQVVDQTGTAVARFTDDRERALATDGLALLRLDHPLVASQMAKWRSTPPKRLSSSDARLAAGLPYYAGGCSKDGVGPETMSRF